MCANVVVVGAGPYGLTAAAHLRRRGMDVSVFGDPMSFWRSMPSRMLLRSNWGATSFVERAGPLSLDAFIAETGARFEAPVPIESFLAYGEWVQRSVVPDVDPRFVARIARTRGSFVVRLDDGAELTASRVVVACGIASFSWRPPLFDAVPPALASHTAEHSNLSVFEGRKVIVVGGGQSALESAALISEAGADVEVLVRRAEVVWLRWPPVKKRLGRLGPIVYAPTDVGPLWYSRLVSQPNLFTHLPRSTQDRIARRSIRPAASQWIRDRLGEKRITLGRSVVAAQAIGDRVGLELDDASTRTVDHVLLGTGYRVDVSRYDFLAEELSRDLATVDGYPVLRRGFESSIPGLHFLGAPAARSFGPIMRFVSGSWYSGQELAARLYAGGTPSPSPPGLRRAHAKPSAEP